jgi:hypothetical protein
MSDRGIATNAPSTQKFAMRATRELSLECESSQMRHAASG